MLILPLTDSDRITSAKDFCGCLATDGAKSLITRAGMPNWQTQRTQNPSYKLVELHVSRYAGEGY